MQELSLLRAQVDEWDVLRQRVTDALDLLEMAEDDPALLAELENEAYVAGKGT